MFPAGSQPPVEADQGNYSVMAEGNVPEVGAATEPEDLAPASHKDEHQSPEPNASQAMSATLGTSMHGETSQLWEMIQACHVPMMLITVQSTTPDGFRSSGFPVPDVM